MGTNVCAAGYAFTTAGNPVLVFGQGPAYTLPATAGTAGQVLTQQADGTLTFADQPWTQSGANIYPTTLTNKVGIGTATPAALLDVAGSVKLGTSGTVLAGISRFTRTLAVGTITAGSGFTITIGSLAGVVVGGTASVSPGTDLPTGIVISSARTGSGSVVFQLYNATTGNIIVPSNIFYLTVVQ